MKKTKCSECEFCAYFGNGISGGYHCKHKNIYDSCREYERQKKKKIYKAPWFIGYELPKTALRYCPKNMEELKNEQENR